MPLERCTIDGKEGWRWGSSGKCYTGPEGRALALRQARAILANQGDSLPSEWPDAFRIDRADVLTKVERTPEGYLKGDAIVSRTGVFIYHNPDGSIRRELRHPDDVFAADSLETLKLVPVTNDHPPTTMLDSATAKTFQIGATGDNVRPDGKYLKASLVITDADAVASVEGGKRGLSCGYKCDLIREDGVYDGQPYDYRQTAIRYNHLAICHVGRAGRDARLRLDSLDISESVEYSDSDPQPDRRVPMVKYRIDGIDYDAAPEVVNYVNKLDAQIKTLSSERDALKGERDSWKDKYDALKAEAAKVDLPKLVSEGVKARLDVERKARAVLTDKAIIEKLDSMSDTDIRKAVILAVFPRATLDNASDAYLAARFDAACEVALDDKGERRSDALASNRALSAPDLSGERKDSVDAYGRYVSRLMNGGKEPAKK